jgi:isoamylase
LTVKIWPGLPYPLGASFDGEGTNFSVFSHIARRIELCLFDAEGRQLCVDLPEMSGYCWHGYLPEIGPGQRYGFRVHGPWDPTQGHRCNPAKLLLDPYAKAIEGSIAWHEAVYPYSLSDGPEHRNEADSAAFVPRSVVHSAAFEWEGDRPLRLPWHETIIYETHVKGFTIRHCDVPPQMRGTYAGLAHPAAIGHLKRLGITAVELMPVHQFVHRKSLCDRGLRNYWGYDSIGFFAPHNEYAADKSPHGAVAEFKSMVKALHRAGIEVILDVVYNHTAEGNELGPMLSFKGLDNEAYYHLVANDRSRYMDFTGTGNSFNMGQPRALQLVMDSLRYWILEMHVDGFRFDLAAALARQLYEVERLAAFFDLVLQDPVVSQVKLIAEPWDVGSGGYQVGNFPPSWSEWNGRYRDCIRDFWHSRDRTLGELASRVTGSSDLYENTGRSPFASVNFVTAHDGFTLRDLVSYDRKHNEANGEMNRDGTDDNRSWNCGIEGDTDDVAILELRAMQQRNFLATLLLSQGVPMLLGGDEIGRTQHGNDNAYCQDNEVGWYDWARADQGLLEFCRQLIALRREHAVFRRRRLFQGRAIHGDRCSDIAWFAMDGRPMSDELWNEGFVKTLGIFLNGEAIAEVDVHGRRISDACFYLMFNADPQTRPFTIPSGDWTRPWWKTFDTHKGWPAAVAEPLQAGARLEVPGRSLVLLQSRIPQPIDDHGPAAV